jgi:hypothetical protein
MYIVTFFNDDILYFLQRYLYVYSKKLNILHIAIL